MHPADIADRTAIPTATKFVASLFLGQGKFATAEADSLDAARDAAKRLASEHASSRRPMVYAVLPDGRSIFIPADYDPASPAPAKAYNKRFNAQRAAKVVLGGDAVEGLDFRTVKTERGWVWQPAGSPPAPQPEDQLAVPTFLRRDPAPAGRPAASTPSERTIDMPKKTKPSRKAAAKRAPGGKRAAIEAAARNGKLPPAPDFSAPTHARFRKKLAEVVALAKAGDVRGLKSYKINPCSSSPKAIDRYRNLAILALQART